MARGENERNGRRIHFIPSVLTDCLVVINCFALFCFTLSLFNTNTVLYTVLQQAFGLSRCYCHHFHPDISPPIIHNWKQAFTCRSEATTRKTGNAFSPKELVGKASNNSTSTEHSGEDSEIKMTKWSRFYEATITRSQKATGICST